jgi:YVTN family beta-propeller protein
MILPIAAIAGLLVAIPEGVPAADQRLYVVNEQSNTVSVIDPAARTIVATVPTGSRPQSVNVDPQGRFFYVTVLFTKESDDLIQVFDVTTNAMLTSVVVGHEPAYAVSSPAGTRLYVASRAANTVSVIAVPEFKRIETIKLMGKGPRGAAITPDGKTLVTPNSRSGDVSVVDLQRGRVDLAKLPPGARPVAVGVNENGRLAYVTDVGLNQVHQIDVTRKVVLASLSVGEGPMQTPTHPTRPFLYIPCMDAAAVYKVNVNTWDVEKVIAVGRGAQGIAYSRDGRYAYVTLTRETPHGKVAVINTETDEVEATIPVEDGPNGIAVLFGKNQGG